MKWNRVHPDQTEKALLDDKPMLGVFKKVKRKEVGFLCEELEMDVKRGDLLLCGSWTDPEWFQIWMFDVIGKDVLYKGKQYRISEDDPIGYNIAKLDGNY